MNNNERDLNVNENGFDKFVIEDMDDNDFSDVEGTGHIHHRHHHHSHSHSRRGHHHSSSKKRISRKKQDQKERIKRFIRHNKKYIVYCVIALSVFLCMLFAGNHLDDKIITLDSHTGDGTEQFQGEKIKPSHLQVEIPFFAEDVVIVSPAVDAFIKAEAGTDVSDIYKIYEAYGARLDVGAPVELFFDVSESLDGYNVKKTEILVSDNKEFVNPFVFNLDGYETKVDVYNLKTGTKYFYRINLTFTNGTETSVSGNFTTAEGPRVMNVDGVYNMRDIGGWETSYGRKIKQGLLYRGCEIDGAVESKYTISEDGINTMLTVLGIKTDMDLRSESDNIYGTDILGVGVKHNYYNTNMYSAVLTDAESKENIRKVFSDLADKNNYPIYLHCTYGQDRTGTVCYLLEALLGVSEENMMKDYQLSGLHYGDIYGGEEPMAEFILNLKKLDGESMSQKVENYLLSIGVTSKEISSIRNIFLVD